MSSAGPRLIVNADDFGLSPAINRGVVAAHRDGIVTSASIMVNGPAFDDAVALAGENPTLDLGVHLTLTELAPISPSDAVSSLVGIDKRFLPHGIDLARRYVRGAVALAEVRNELDSQLRLARSRGLAISHIDSHQHVHALPGIARVVADLAKAYGIRVVRHPGERLRGYMMRTVGDARRLAQQIALNGLCLLAPLRQQRHADRFVGFHFGGRLDERNLATVLRALPAAGSVELMCHPAELEADGPHRRWGYAGPAERAALTSPSTKALIGTLGIELIAHRDL